MKTLHSTTVSLRLSLDCVLCFRKCYLKQKRAAQHFATNSVFWKSPWDKKVWNEKELFLVKQPRLFFFFFFLVPKQRYLLAAVCIVPKKYRLQAKLFYYCESYVYFSLKECGRFFTSMLEAGALCHELATFLSHKEQRYFPMQTTSFWLCLLQRKKSVVG